MEIQKTQRIFRTETFLLPKASNHCILVVLNGLVLRETAPKYDRSRWTVPDPGTGQSCSENIYEKSCYRYSDRPCSAFIQNVLWKNKAAQKELYAGNPCIVCGMHHALFLPFTFGPDPGRYGRTSGTQKQDAAPHLHSRDTALMMGQMFRAQVILGSVIPSLETFYNLKNKFQHLAEVQEKNFSGPRLLLPTQSNPLISNAMKGVLT